MTAEHRTEHRTEHLTEHLTGLGVALATPFTPGTMTPEGGAKPALDLPAYRRLVRHVLDGGVDFLVVLGSTGEAATVSDVERERLVTLTRALAPRTPVVVGVGHNSTERTCELARAAVDAGADGLLVVTPFYNKPQPAGIEAHFREVCATTPGTPVIAYNVPGRTGVNLDPATLQRLWTIPEVVAIKESSGDLAQIARICAQVPAGRHVLAGDDDLALGSIAVGAVGLVSVCANVAPQRTARLVHAAMEGDLTTARALARELLPLMDALFAESNPVPLKAALASLGLGSAMVRAPLAPASPQTWSAVQHELGRLGLTRVAATPLAS